MSRRALVQEEQRISDMQGIGVEAFVKQFARIGKLGFEFGTHLMSHNVAATANAWPDDGTQLAGSAAEMAAHLSDTLLDDARHGSAPTGMEGPDGPALTIHHENRNAVGGLHRQQQARGASDQAIASQRRGRYGIDEPDNARMDLPYLNQRPWLAVGVRGSQRFDKPRPIP